jgi:hypothetical protein
MPDEVVRKCPITIKHCANEIFKLQGIDRRTILVFLSKGGSSRRPTEKHAVKQNRSAARRQTNFEFAIAIAWRT